MGQGANQSYEVQVYHGKRWIVHATYEAHERGVAVTEAKDLDGQRQNVAIRVIMIELNARTNRHDEILIYRNKIETNIPVQPQRNWADMAVSTDGRVGYLPDEYDELFDPFEEAARKKPKVTIGMLAAIVGMILVIGAASGVLAAGILALLMNAFEVSLAGSARQLFLIGMLGVVWIIASSSSYNYYKAKFDLNPFGKRKPPPVPVKKSKLSKQMEKAAAEIDKVPVQEVDPTPESDFPTSIYADMEIELQESDDDVGLSDEAEQQKMFLINFLGTCLSALKGPDADKSNFNRFGLNLFMTGATIRISTDHSLTSEEEHEILCRILEMLGAKPDQAERFALDYEKYLNTPRHKELFEYAGDIAVRFSDGDQAAPLYIRETIEEWVNWKPPVEDQINPNLLTIMFTDMVGSTDLTTKHGDYAAQEVLKAHDLIVRTALTNLEGKEIKHLGDGIMASFKDFDMAVQAAIEIQKRVEGNNNAGPEFPLHVRIGMNAGEPIKKDNDLFGTSVQLAARLCDSTESDCISLSQDLVNLFGEQPIYTFVEMGPQMLKGFDEPTVVYQLDWHAEPLEYDEEEETDIESDQEEPAEADVAIPASPASDETVADEPVSETDVSPVDPETPEEDSPKTA